MQPVNLITLTTDFGLADPYVGQIKGVILRHNINARIVDLTHAIEPQDILTAALTIHSAYRFFPAGSIHVAVVDPGVGSGRMILAVLAGDHFFIAPDNGILTLLLRDGQVRAVHRIDNRSLFPPDISATFHGRDIMAPVAAQLAGGMALDRVGPAIAAERCIRLDIPAARHDGKGIGGQVIGMDRFGNIRTSITTADLDGRRPDAFAGVVLGAKRIDAIVSTYSDRPAGELLALIDSSGYLEIAVNRGNAAKLTGCRIGDPVRLILAPPPKRQEAKRNKTHHRKSPENHES